MQYMVVHLVIRRKQSPLLFHHTTCHNLLGLFRHLGGFWPEPRATEIHTYIERPRRPLLNCSRYTFSTTSATDYTTKRLPYATQCRASYSTDDSYFPTQLLINILSNWISVIGNFLKVPRILHLKVNLSILGLSSRTEI